MKILLIPASYPHAAAEWAGAFNERSAVALRDFVQHLEVLTPRPYSPRLLNFQDRWKVHAAKPKNEVRRGIRVHRPAYPRIPGVLQAFWSTTAKFVFSRRLVTALHREVGFDAILSFDLAGAGGLAWRLGGQLGIPAAGWAIGSDTRWDPSSPSGRSVRETLRHLDLVFYQSGELKELAAKLLDTGTEALSKDRHVVQARGVGAPKTLPDTDARRVVRGNLGLSDGQLVILYLGGISRQKGLFDLVDSFAQWGRARPDLVLLLVGSRPGHDATPELQIRIETTALKERIRIVPGCPPDKVWDYFSAADIFAFPSFREGMPNSLLEAMLSCLPSVAFGIPCVQEILRFGKGLVDVPPYDFSKFGAALLSLAADPSRMRGIGERGRTIVCEHFSIDKSTCAVVGHLSSMCSRPSARPPRGG